MNIHSNKQKFWYVIYTRPRAEKKVAKELAIKNIEHYLPLQKKLRKWSDRKKWVEIPLISGYCFVKISQKEFEQVHQTNNVVCFVTFEGKAAKIPEEQINYLKRLLKQSEIDVTVTQENFEKGQQVEVIAGPLIGLRGELIEARGKQKFILRFRQINSIFTVEISNSDITRISDSLK